VRGYNGRNFRWYQAAVRQKARRIIAAGMTKEITFEPVDGPINNRIDDAYRAKYHGSPYLSPMIGARVRPAMLTMNDLFRWEKFARLPRVEAFNVPRSVRVMILPRDAS
jgi:hypothetical protein